ncbi:unnamed protein product [Prorocentrum cordatum]|uniref:Uncharacterized protein n=1 Tax=Prorocentrum cordatum TaxID=2364126 RepID=A0ABN9W547_9DINO|nr:unnamed protein product [Polarella glacialis]
MKAHHSRGLCGEPFEHRLGGGQPSAFLVVDRVLKVSSRAHQPRAEKRADQARADARRRSESRRREKPMPDKEAKLYVAKIAPMTRHEAAEYQTHQEAPQGDVLLQKRFQDETRAKVLEMARRANELDDAYRYDAKLSALRCMV